MSCLWNQFFFLGHLSFIEIDWPIWIQLIQNSGWKIANSKVVAPGHTFVVWNGNYSDWTPHEFQLISLLPIRQAWSVIVKTEVQWGQRWSYLSASALSPNLYIFHILRMRLSKILAGNILWTTCVIVLITSTQTHPLALAKRKPGLLNWSYFCLLPVLGMRPPTTGCTSLAAGKPPFHPPEMSSVCIPS